MTNILILVGSLRKESLNRKFAAIASEQTLPDVKITTYDISDLPLYNQDLEDDLPPVVQKFKSAVKDSDGLLFISPENNGTIPAVLKNSIDWASRPYGDGPIKGKPFAAIGTSLGPNGGEWVLADILKSAGIAGGTPIDKIKLAIPASAYGGVDPSSDSELAQKIRKAVSDLVEAI